MSFPPWPSSHPLAGTVLLGMLLAWEGDLYSLFWAEFRPRRLPGHLADLLYWLVTLVSAAGGLFFLNGLSLRLYVVLGVGLGIWLYLRLGSPVLSGPMRFFLHLGHLFTGTALAAVRFLLRPATALFRRRAGDSRSA